MATNNPFSHDQSRYERPNFPYRCGRSVLWQKPCHDGPEFDGSCGGVTECSPAKKGDRWECRRTKMAGGPCEDGPDSSGKCSRTQPPCSPRSTLRVIRGRLAMLALGIIIALIGGSQGVGPNEVAFLDISDPGPISKPHSKFTENKGCQACHANHGKGVVAWTQAVFSENDISAQCVDCHTFGGPSFVAHNRTESKDKSFDSVKTKCTMCHREHTGNEITRKLTSEQCNSCHKTQFESFARGHPKFSEKYPYESRTSIFFDHVSHLGKHFKNLKHADKAPKLCTGCHIATFAKQEVKPAGFETCEKCHGNQIGKKELVLLRLPEFTQNLMDPELVRDVCGGSDSAESDDDFMSVSTDKASLVSAYLLNIPTDDPEVYNQPLQKFLEGLVEESSGPLVELIKEKTGQKSMTEKMLFGLNPEALKRAVCAWGANREYDPPAEAMGGWYADLLELRYRPSEHGDAVAKSWIEFAISAVENTQDEEEMNRALELREQILSPKEGVGGCIKCHSISNVSMPGQNPKLEVAWKYKDSVEKPHMRFIHDSHIEMLGLGSSCSNCHHLDNEADYASSFKTFDATRFVANFKPIEKAKCVNCHNEGKIKQDCQVCHKYHFKTGFKQSMLALNEKNEATFKEREPVIGVKEE